MIQKVETPAKTKDKRLQVVVEITFCTHVGWDGILVMVLTLGIAGLFVSRFCIPKGFQTYMVFALLYVLLVMKYLYSWKKMATVFTEQHGSQDGLASKWIKRVFGISIADCRGLIFGVAFDERRRLDVVFGVVVWTQCKHSFALLGRRLGGIFGLNAIFLN